MSKELENLNKEELINLKQDIDSRLKVLEIKETKPKYGKLLSLKKGDKIFGLRLSFGGHRLVDPIELDGEVDVIDYCTVEGVEISEDRDYLDISISHDTEAFGISTSLGMND